MPERLGQLLWSVLALFAVAAVALDLGRWGSARLSDGEAHLAALPALSLAAAAATALLIGARRDDTRNPAQLLAVGSTLALAGYGLLTSVS
ncbi:hypothetical protein [Methylopila sp. M107]|uniref:hypothetical protein n=1 Tax=Methylopila sp. M107 TaxID=1101190 RepID=UPI00036F82B1|nr:hypothetical protein [Methylopila sp. M107]